MKQSDWIAYVGPFEFPSGQADTHRVHGIARSLTNAGHHVVICSGESVPVVPATLEPVDGQGSLSYVGLGELPMKNASAITKAMDYVAHLGKRTVQWLDQQPTKPSHVIIYGSHASLVLRLLRWCRRNGVALIVDVVEWFDSWHVLGGPISPLNISHRLALRVLNPRTDGIVAISSYLADFYRSRGCRVIRIPPTLDVTNTAHRLTADDGVLTIAYAGFPGKKDLLGNIVEAVLNLDPEGKQLRLIIAGPEPEDILRLPQLRTIGLSSLPDSIVPVGLKTREQVLHIVRNADFVPLLRLPKRYAQAGFASKVPESLASGTPVICNITGDLGEYIHDGVEGFICSDYSVVAFVEALQRALATSMKARTEMRTFAREQAECSFDYRNYAERLSTFLRGTRLCV